MIKLLICYMESLLIYYSESSHRSILTNVLGWLRLIALIDSSESESPLSSSIS